MGASLSDKWKGSETKKDGSGGNYLTTYFWIKGNQMGNDLVGLAQKKSCKK